MPRRKRDSELDPTDDSDRPGGWLRAYQLNPDLREFYDLGLIDFSLEGLVRYSPTKGGVHHVDVNERSLAQALIELSDERCEKEFMMFALQAVAQALLRLESGYRLEIKQSRPGRPTPQLPDRRQQARREAAMLATVEHARARDMRSPAKVAAKEHRCSSSTIRRARAKARKQALPPESEL